jgi:hypothetical protein
MLLGRNPPLSGFGPDITVNIFSRISLAKCSWTKSALRLLLKLKRKWRDELELTVEDVRQMVGGYVLELIGKDKEIARLKQEIELLKANDLNTKVPHNLSVVRDEVAQ